MRFSGSGPHTPTRYFWENPQGELDMVVSRTRKKTKQRYLTYSFFRVYRFDGVPVRLLQGAGLAALGNKSATCMVLKCTERKYFNTEGSYNEALESLKTSAVWQNDTKLQTRFSKKWLPEKRYSMLPSFQNSTERHLNSAQHRVDYHVQLVSS